MSFMYSRALAKIQTSDIQVTTHDIRALLVMALTNADTEEDAEFLTDLSLDEYDGASYARQALTTEAVSVDTTNDWGKFTSDPVVFASLGPGTSNCVGMVLFRWVSNDGNSFPIAFIDAGGFPFAGVGENVTITPHANGWWHAKNAA